MYGKIRLFPALFLTEPRQAIAWRPQLLQPTIGLKTTISFRSALSETDAKTDKPPLPFYSIPGPTFLENLTTLWREGMGNLHHIIKKNFEKYGPIYKVTMPDTSTPMVFVCYPEDIEKVFRADKYPPLRPLALNYWRNYFLGKGLSEGILGDDEHWHRHRQSIAPYILRPVEIQHLVSSLCDTSDDSINFFTEGRNEDLIYHFYNWSTESVALVLFGSRIGVNSRFPDAKARSFINAVHTFFETHAQLHSSLPVHKYFMTPTLKRLYRALDTKWDVSSNYIKREKKQQILSEKEKPFVQKMIEGNRYQMSQDEITQAINIIFGAGVDTTAVSTIGVLNNLSKFPRIQEKLHEEIRRVLPNDEKPTHKQLANMPYLRAVLKESFRVNPTALGTNRQTVEAIVLSGYEIPAGTNVVVSLYSSKAVSKKAFSDFEDFRPERWLRGGITHHPFASVPFGFGPRMCVGKRLAEMEVSLFVIRLLQRFEIESSDLEEDKVDWKFNMIMEPVKPFNINLKKRN